MQTGDQGESLLSRSKEHFTYRVTDGWLRDLASEPTPHDSWPCIRWDEKLLADQVRFLDVQAELGIDHNVVWGLFVDRVWPVPLKNVIDAAREEKLRAFVDAAHARGVKVLSGVGIYSWGFDEVIRQAPGVSAGHTHAMCGFSDAAWEWQRRVLDFLMEPRWGLDGISMQSADQGRCDCEKCRRLSPAEHHARLLVRSAEHVRAGRPEWVIGQASWGLRLDDPGEFPHLQQISRAVDYMVEVRELTAEARRRAEIARGLACAFGSVGGVFSEPPQHWERSRWFLPCGLGSARSLARLWADGGRACEYFYRPFANPGEEVSWRTGARILSAPQTQPEEALGEAVAAVYGVTGGARAVLVEWYARAEAAYFSRSSFQVGHGSLSLEPLIWKENPAVPGPPIYLRDQMTPEARAEYARELEALKQELQEMEAPNQEAVERTVQCVAGAIRDVVGLAAVPAPDVHMPQTTQS
jgi:hypothetical protein